ncbi:exo-alpha-sialidase [Streptomyces sp. NPDC127039]|uniref:exo-alpha-sialidase n=1 Tax=Streptomyces sp. NPDC127039 TaxID=3347115 RepID=UPI00364DD21D
MRADAAAPQIRFDARGGADELVVDARTLALAAGDAAGTLQLDVATTIDGPLLAIRGEHGSITLEVTDGRIDGWVRCRGEVRQLDAEDTVGFDDGRVHSVALTVDATGTHLFVDGYEAFSATTTAWFAALEPTSVEVDTQGVMTPSRLTVWSTPLTANAVVAQSVAEKALVEFAAAELSPRDVRRLGSLGAGSIRARCRTRGEGQGGVILQGGGAAGTLTLAVEDGDITFTVTAGDTLLAGVRAPGHWDDGNWHDVVLVSGRGALALYVDGFQVLHEAGAVFFRDLGPLERVVVGADLQGTRLFGEAQSAAVYDTVLSDHQVKRLASVEPLETCALFDTGMADSRSYRIPALLTLASGVVVAGADQRVSIPNDSPNDTNFVVRRSLDGGRSWEPVRTVLRYPGSGRLGTSVTDSVIVQDRDSGRVVVLIDQFPGGHGQPNAQAGTGYDEHGRMILTDRDGTVYLREADGGVVAADGGRSPYRVADDGAVTRDGRPAGNIHLAAGVDPDESLLSARTAYFQMLWSDDDGETWNGPRDITPQVKEDWMRFFGTSPGNGIQLERGKHRGRLLMPVYYNHEEGRTFSCAAVFSDDAGRTWRRGASPNDGRMLDGVELSSRDLVDDRGSLYESVLVEGSDGSVHAYMRNQHPTGRVAHATSTDGGETWGEVTFVAQIPEIFSQPNAVRVTLGDGREATVFANASQMLPFRGRGVLRMSFDDGRTWPHNRVLNPRHHVYQSMAQLPDGRLAVLWEREWQGLFLTVLPLSWLTASRSTDS